MAFKLISRLWKDKGVSVINIPIERISYNPHQVRKRLYDQSLEELASSIRVHGVVQPVIVRELEDRYELIAGHRRLEAARMAGLGVVPAIVRDVPRDKSLELALIENLQRKDLNPIEEAEGYKYLLEEFGLTQEQIAHRLGKSRAAVANALRLLKLPAEVQDNVSRETLSMGHARALLGLGDAQAQVELMHVVIKERLSVRETEDLVRGLGQPPAKLTKQVRKAAVNPLESFRGKVRRAVENLRRRGVDVTAIELEQEDSLEIKIRVGKERKEVEEGISVSR